MASRRVYTNTIEVRTGSSDELTIIGESCGISLPQVCQQTIGRVEGRVAVPLIYRVHAESSSPSLALERITHISEVNRVLLLDEVGSVGLVEVPVAERGVRLRTARRRPVIKQHIAFEGHDLAVLVGVVPKVGRLIVKGSGKASVKIVQ